MFINKIMQPLGNPILVEFQNTRNIIKFFFSFLTCVLSIHAKSDVAKIEKGYVAYATENFYPYLEILLDSHKAFSKYPIVVFGINSDIPFSTDKYPLLIKRIIYVPFIDRDSIMFAKPKIILLSNIKNGIYVDADMILNDGVDNLFDNHKNIKNYPLCPEYIYDNNGQRLKDLMRAMKVSYKTLPYVQAQLIFSDKCKDFLIEWEKSCRRFKNLSMKVDHDESVLNVLLWKYNAKDCVNCWEPWYPLAYDYINDTLENHPNLGYERMIGKLHYYMFHGCKDTQISRNILNSLISKKVINQINIICK